MVASSYNSGDIGAVAPFLATKLAENYMYYISRVTTNFHAQRPAHRAKVTPNGFITNAPHPRVRRASRGTLRVPHRESWLKKCPCMRMSRWARSRRARVGHDSS